MRPIVLNARRFGSAPSDHKSMSAQFQRFALRLAVFGCLLTTGCGGGPYTAEVTGKVMLDDKPLTKGDVIFHPTAGGPLAYGTIGPDGRYALRTAGSQGLIPGVYAATVVAYTKEPWEGIADEQVEQIRLVPPRYAEPKTSDQQFNIAAGANQCDMRLTSH
jgi:hypothetical protein